MPGDGLQTRKHLAVMLAADTAVAPQQEEEEKEELAAALQHPSMVKRRTEELVAAQQHTVMVSPLAWLVQVPSKMSVVCNDVEPPSMAGAPSLPILRLCGGLFLQGGLISISDRAS